MATHNRRVDAALIIAERGRQPVKTKRGRIASHLTPGGVKCVGVGQPLRKA